MPDNTDQTTEAQVTDAEQASDEEQLEEQDLEKVKGGWQYQQPAPKPWSEASSTGHGDARPR